MNSSKNSYSIVRRILTPAFSLEFHGNLRKIPEFGEIRLLFYNLTLVINGLSYGN